MKKLSCALVLALGLAVVGCGDDEETPPLAVDGGGQDLGQADMNTPDVDLGPSDDAGPIASCEGAGGTCEPLTATSCMDGGTLSSIYSCGLEGSGCCIPETAGCVAAGGLCVAVYPGACVGTPTTDSCGTGVGVQCCMPGTIPDAGPAEDAGPVPTCAEAGGACVAVVPGACAGGTPAPEYSCGPGVGTSCCLTADAGVP